MKTANISGRQSCDYCLDTGFVVVEGPDSEGYDEAVGPCPFCEQGNKQEFPDLGGDNSSQKIRPPWGRDGFWRDRDTSFLTPMRHEHFHLTPDDQRSYLRTALKELGMDAVKDLNKEIAPKKHDDEETLL